MNQNLPDVAEVRLQARKQWEDSQHHATKYELVISIAIPVGLLVISAVFFALSAQHTVDVFKLLVTSENVAGATPIGVELGLMYTAFVLAEAGTQKQMVSKAIKSLRWLLFAIMIIANGTGALFTVVKAEDISKLSIGQIVNQFGGLPATSQVALLLALLAALAIPIVAVASGEGFFNHLADIRKNRKSIEQRWIEVKAGVEYEALRDAAVNSGLTPKAAARWASDIAHARQSANLIPTATGQTSSDTLGQPQTQRKKAVEMLRENPGLSGLSLRVLEDKTGVPKSAWEYAKKEVEYPHNNRTNGRHE